MITLFALVERAERRHLDAEQLLSQRVDLAVAIGELGGEPVEDAVDVRHAVAAERDGQPQPVEVDGLDHAVVGQPDGRPVRLGVAELATAAGRDNGDGTEDRGHEEHQDDYHTWHRATNAHEVGPHPGVPRSDSASGGVDRVQRCRETDWASLARCSRRSRSARC